MILTVWYANMSNGMILKLWINCVWVAQFCNDLKVMFHCQVVIYLNKIPFG